MGPRRGVRLCVLGGVYGLGVMLIPVHLPPPEPRLLWALRQAEESRLLALQAVLQTAWPLLLVLLGAFPRARRRLAGLAVAVLLLSVVTSTLQHVELAPDLTAGGPAVVAGAPTFESVRATLRQVVDPALAALAAFTAWAGVRLPARRGRPGFDAAFRGGSPGAGALGPGGDGAGPGT